MKELHNFHVMAVKSVEVELYKIYYNVTMLPSNRLATGLNHQFLRFGAPRTLYQRIALFSWGCTTTTNNNINY